MGSDWRDAMFERQEAAARNECRELVEVAKGSEWKIRKLQEKFPKFLWKYSDCTAVPDYVLTIAKQLEQEFDTSGRVPTDLYPREYFRVMKHSYPTDMALQPRRVDTMQTVLADKLREHYETHESELLISEEHLVPKMACAVRIQDTWYRARLENEPTTGPWLFVSLVDSGASQQVNKSEIRHLPVHFGHYPRMAVRAVVRGAFVQRMDAGKIARFQQLLEHHDYVLRCQFISSTEPFQVNLIQPICDDVDVFAFLLAPPRGLPSHEADWPPSRICQELEENDGSPEYDNTDSDDGDFSDDENAPLTVYYVRSFPRSTKAYQLNEQNMIVRRVVNERLIYVSTEHQMKKLNDVQDYLENLAAENELVLLPDQWHLFGSACATRHEGAMKRAAICGGQGDEFELVLIDYGIIFKTDVSNVFSLPQNTDLPEGPLLTLISNAAFPDVHFSRVKVLREILPHGTRIQFNRDRKSKDIPIKGTIHLEDGSDVADLVVEQIDARLDVDCRALVPYQSAEQQSSVNPVNKDHLCYCRSYDIYKRSKPVTSKY